MDDVRCKLTIETDGMRFVSKMRFGRFSCTACAVSLEVRHVKRTTAIPAQTASALLAYTHCVLVSRRRDLLAETYHRM
jgi:hypothetical protein